MKLYEVTDGDEIERHFSSKAEAIRFAKETDRYAREEASVDGGWRCTVTMVTTRPLTLKLLLAIMNHEGYALTQTQVWPPNGEG